MKLKPGMLLKKKFNSFKSYGTTAPASDGTVDFYILGLMLIYINEEISCKVYCAENRSILFVDKALLRERYMRSPKTKTKRKRGKNEA